MKFFRVVILALVATSFGCMESLPPINFGNFGGFDNFEVNLIPETDIPDTVIQMITIEDLTGVRCVNCPDAAQRAKEIQAKHPDQVYLKAIYPQAPKNLTLPYDGYEDFRTEFTQLIYTNIFEATALPGGGINRAEYGGVAGINRPFSTWESGVDEMLDDTAIVSLDISQTKLNDSVVRLSVSALFLDDIQDDAFISISLLEDNLKAPQKSISGTDYEYKHSHVLRQMFTPYNGSKLIESGDVKRGITVSFDLDLTIDPKINQSNSEIAVEINYNSAENKELIQCARVGLD